MSYSSESSYPWLNLVQYPFMTREFDCGEGWMSYVDHGQGRPVVFVHGNPTWSYLYRHLIRDIGRTNRCVAPDLLGFGLSEKPHRADFRPEAQAERFSRLMDYLKLEDVTLVVQDAGGPIGLSWAIDHPNRVRNLVIFNTWMWPLDDNRGANRLARLMNHPMNRIFYRMLKASPAFIVPAMFGDRHRISGPARVQYMEPFRNYRDRLALYGMVEGITRSRRWYAELWSRRESIAHIRTLLLWGMRDLTFNEEALNRFEELFTDHETHRIAIAGRFVPEEEPKTASEAMRWFLLTHSAVGAI